MAARSMGRARTARKRRAAVGFAVSILLAGAVGWALGLRSHTTLEEVNASHTAQRAQDADISSEINRVMLELWRMEDVEQVRNSGGRIR